MNHVKSFSLLSTSTIFLFLPPLLILLPFFLFHFLFTLLSKFFSAFVHTTCSLSVSRPCLAFRVRYPVHSRSIPNERDSFSLFASSPHRFGFFFSLEKKYGSLTLFVYSRPPSSKLLAFSRLFQVSVNPAFYFQISESRASSKGLFPTRHQCHSFRIASSPLELSPPSLAVTTGIDVSFFSSGY